MRKQRDRIKPLLSIIATADPKAVRQQAQRTLKEIQDEQAALARDIKLIRDLVRRYGGTVDEMTPRKRSEKVKEAALALVGEGKRIITPQDVLDYVEQTEGVRFDVRKPASLVGTVLAGMKNEFERVEQNRFAYLGNSLLEDASEIHTEHDRSADEP